MARPPLALGTPGNVTVTAYGGKFIAYCWFRDYDGRTRKIERHGKTKTAARTRLHNTLGQLRGSPPNRCARTIGSSEQPFRLTKVDAWVADGELADTTAHRRNSARPGHRPASMKLPGVPGCRSRGRVNNS